MFGSSSRGEETSESDVDILVIFDRSAGPIGLMRHARMMLDLEERPDRKVDLVRTASVGRPLRSTSTTRTTCTSSTAA